MKDMMAGISVHERNIGSRAPLVLVVEDDPLVRFVLGEMVAGLGFAVLEAATAGEAMEMLEGDHCISLVISDYMMPGDMDGLQLTREIKKRWPSVEVILTSGEQVADAGSLPRGSTFAAKPFIQATLMRTLRALDHQAAKS